MTEQLIYRKLLKFPNITRTTLYMSETTRQVTLGELTIIEEENEESSTHTL